MKKIEVLGSGCAKCIKLEELARKAVKETGIDAEVTKVKDINQIMDYGIMTTPALVVDGEVKTAGRVPSIEDIKNYIK